MYVYFKLALYISFHISKTEHVIDVVKCHVYTTGSLVSLPRKGVENLCAGLTGLSCNYLTKNCVFTNRTLFF